MEWDFSMNRPKYTCHGTEREYIEIEYAEKDRLFVPVEELHRVSKFVGETTPTL
jgi:transcription-repair coupling factor (superfamily II helicase)